MVTARNGAEAMAAYDAHAIDIVITDLRMPIMDGNELIRRLRGADADLPIIVATGHTMLYDEEDIVADGASAVITKPIRLRELGTLIGTFLRSDEATAEVSARR